VRVYVNYCTIHVRSVHVRACAYSYVMIIAFRGLRPHVYTKKSAAAAAEPHVHLKPAAGRRPTCWIVISPSFIFSFSFSVHGYTVLFAYLPICLFALKSEELLLRRHDWVTPNVPYSPLVTGGNCPIVLLGLRMHAPARAPLDAAPWPSPKIHRSV